MKTAVLVIAAGLLLLPLVTSSASTIALQNAQATANQTNFDISEAIDGIVGTFPENNNGWALNGFQFSNQTAIFETTSTVTTSTLQFDLLHRTNQQGHKLNQFRISWTSDATPTFGGTWFTISPDSAVTSDAVSTASIAGDVTTISTAGANNMPDDYTVTATGSFSGITGFRLEAFAFDDGAGATIGFGSTNTGNIVLSEFQAAIPEPSRSVLGLVGIAFTVLRRRR